MFRHFADVQQPFRARNDFDKRAEIRQPRDFAQICLAHLGRRGDVSDNLQRFLCRRLIAGRNFHQPGIFHIDLHSGLFHDRANHFSARPDQVADLVGRDLHRVEPRRVIGNLLAPAGNHFLHFFEDVHPAALRLR